MSIFGEETIPAFESPELSGHEEETAVETENEEVLETEQETVDTEEKADPEQGHSDELLAGKYKDPQQLAKAYEHAQRKISELSEQVRQKQSPEQIQQQQQSPEDYNNAVYEAFNRDPAGTINFLVQQQIQQALAPIQEERQFGSLSRNMEPIANEYAQIHNDEGVGQLLEKVKEIAQDLGNPELYKNPSQRVLRMAAAELWGTETKANIYDKAVAKGRQEAEELRRNKQGVAVSVTTKPKEAPKTEADLVRDSILAAGNRGGLFGQ